MRPKLVILPVTGIDRWTGTGVGDPVVVQRTRATSNRTLYLYRVDPTRGPPHKIGYVRAAEVPDYLPDGDECFVGIIAMVDRSSGKVALNTHAYIKRPEPNDITIATDWLEQQLMCYGTSAELTVKEERAAALGIRLKTTDPVPDPAHFTTSAAVKRGIDRTEKDITMNKTTNFALRAYDRNKDALGTAAFLEAGKIANNKLAQVAGKAAPLMLRGYIDTPLGKLALANLVSLAVSEAGTEQSVQLRALVAKYPMLTKLSDAMLTQAYAEAIGAINIEGVIDAILNSDEIKGAMSKLGAAEPKA